MRSLVARRRTNLAEHRTIISTEIRPRSLPPPSSFLFLGIAGDQSAGATLVPIPNTTVKPCSADGTPPERARESRPSPAPFGDQVTVIRHGRPGLFFCPHLPPIFRP